MDLVSVSLFAVVLVTPNAGVLFTVRLYSYIFQKHDDSCSVSIIKAGAVEYFINLCPALMRVQMSRLCFQQGGSSTG